MKNGNLTNGVTKMGTYCRICEPQCGVLATVENGKIIKVEGDRNHVHSKGHYCVKAAAAADMIYDEDRVLTPLKRVGGPGEFQAVTWDEALSDIVGRLKGLRASYGPASFATFVGNPPSFNYATMLWLPGFQAALGVKWRYGVNGEDGAAHLAAGRYLFGSASTVLKPDLWRTKFVLMMGANPFVSHGSGFSEPNQRDALKGVIKRGGRVVVIDPRRSETARTFEHIAVRAGTDAFFLIAMIRTLFDEGRIDRDYVEQHTSGAVDLEALLKSFSADDCAKRCGVPLVVIQQLARDFAASSSGVVYSRTGTCTQRFGTLVNILQDVVNGLTGNIERPGGNVVGWGVIDFSAFATDSGFGKNPTRVYGHPEIMGMHPSTSLAPDILTPGEEQVRALMTIGANPVLSSAAGGERLETALAQLDLHFALDLYVNETNKHAHYILPVASFYERSDVPFLVAGMMLRPSFWHGQAVVERRGEVREEWEIMQDIVRRMGLGGAYVSPVMRFMSKFGIEIKPETMVDMLIRMGPAGDKYGLKPSGLSIKKLKTKYPHGVTLKDELPMNDFEKWVRTPDKRINLCPEIMASEFERLRTHQDDVRYPLRVIGMREIRSHNTWFHNLTRVMPATRHYSVFVNPEDAELRGIQNGDQVVITSKSGAVTTTVRVTTDASPGTVVMPHGWGHKGGWRLANKAGGVNSNLLASGDPADIETIAGMSILSGIPVQIALLSSANSDQRQEATAMQPADFQ